VDPANPTKAHLKRWKIVNGLERMADDSIRTIDNFLPIDLTVHKFSYTEDWVILKRETGMFHEDDVIPICSMDELPVPVYGEEPVVKIYQCPVELFNQGFLNGIRPTSLSVKMGFCSKHKVFLQTKLFNGSGGAVFLISDPTHRGFGKAFGMHNISINNNNSSKESEDIVNDPDEAMSEATDSCVGGCHASSPFVEGLLLPTYKNLMSYIIA